MNEDLQLRPEDFRHAWPHALALAMKEGAALIDAIGEQQKISAEIQAEIHRSSEAELERRSDLEKLLKMTTMMFTQAAMHFHGLQKIGEETRDEFRRTGMQMQAEIRESGLEVSSQIRAMLTDAQNEVFELEKQRTSLYAQRSELAKAQRELNQARTTFLHEKNQFSRMNWWQRLTWRS